MTDRLAATAEVLTARFSGLAPWAALAALLLAAALIAAVYVKRARGARRAPELPDIPKAEEITVTESYGEKAPITVSVGKMHNIGGRPTQQDSLAAAKLSAGTVAVLADGMGGLSDGDKISRKVVLTMMQAAAEVSPEDAHGMLYRITAKTNREVNRMLGADNRYKCGSTMVAALVSADNLEWVSVGDSRLCLFRGEKLLQLNRDHIYESELILRAVNDEMTFADVEMDLQRKRLNSFIGMGRLKAVDGSLHPVSLQKGDRIILMSDGVFNTLSNEEIADVLSTVKEADEAARVLEERVLAHSVPKQDNFTAIILDIL